MKRLKWARTALLGALLGTAVTLATSVTDLRLDEQAQKAEVIVRATLGAAATVKDGDVTYVVYPLSDVRDVIVGDVGRLPQHEGKPALFFLQGVDDLPVMSAGQEVFALLYGGKMDSPLVGFNQGLYPVVQGKVTWNSVMGERYAALARAEAEAQAAAQTAVGTGNRSPGTTTPNTPGTTTPAPSTPAPAATPPPTTSGTVTSSGGTGTGTTGAGTTGTGTPVAGTPAAGAASTGAPGPATPPQGAASPAATPPPKTRVPTLITDPEKFRQALIDARSER